nr:hypothetical protein [Chloroflexus aurantiacus]
MTTPSKRDAPRVAFGQLIAAGYIAVGQQLSNRDRSVIATVKADGHVVWNGVSGSIHAIAARAQNKPAFNGWEYWFVEEVDGSLISIDELRERYRAEHL